MEDKTRPAARATEPNPYTKLPPSISLEQTVTSQDTEDVPDPEGGRNTDRDFMLRYGV